MAVYKVQGPDGAIHRFEGPDDATPEQVTAAAEQQFGSSAPQGQDAGALAAAGEGLANAVPFGQRITSGLGALGAAALGAGNVGDLYNQAQANTQATAEAHPLAAGAGTVAGIIPTLAFGGGLFKWANKPVSAGSGVLSNTANLIGRSVKGAAVSAPLGAAYSAGNAPTVSDMPEAAKTDALISGALGAALPVGLAAGGAALRGAGAGAGMATQALIAPAERETALLAEKAMKHYKIPLSITQASDSTALRNLQKVSQELPLSKAATFKNQQAMAVNKAVAKTFGQDANHITPELIDFSYKKLGSKFDSFFNGKTITFTPDDITSIRALAEEAKNTVGSDAQNIISKNIDTLLRDLSEIPVAKQPPKFGMYGEVTQAPVQSAGATIPGEKFNQIRTQIQEILRADKDQAGNAADPFVSKALDKFMDVGLSNMPEGSKEAFKNLKYQYKNLVAITPAAAKALRGNINPTHLEAAVQRIYGVKEYATGQAGDLGELAKISKTFLPHLGGSDTTQKMLYAAGLTGAGGLANLPATATALGVNRIYQEGNTSQAAVRKYLEKSLKGKK